MSTPVPPDPAYPQDQPMAYGPGYPPPPPGYGYGYGYPYPYPYPPAPSMNVLAVISLAVVLVFWPAAIVCGHIALSQIRRTNESGRGLAIAGLVVGYLQLALIAVVILVIVSASAPN